MSFGRAWWLGWDDVGSGHHRSVPAPEESQSVRGRSWKVWKPICKVNTLHSSSSGWWETCLAQSAHAFTNLSAVSSCPSREACRKLGKKRRKTIKSALWRNASVPLHTWKQFARKKTCLAIGWLQTPWKCCKLCPCSPTHLTGGQAGLSQPLPLSAYQEQRGTQP